MARKGEIVKPLQQRFDEKVEKTDGCWLWRGARDNKGYGQIRVGKRMELAHRVSCSLNYGPIDDTLMVLHRCDNPQCVRPDHLFTGDAKANTADMWSKGRGKVATPLYGADNGFCSHTDEKVAEIRRRYAAGGVTYRALAAEFGVSHGHVWKIVKGKSRAKNDAETSLAAD